ncbi:C-type lectin BfL-2-like [Mercenaria mercenaria]|uniref:C-type lectin BfL-2-like n=1 Tax=Mercenaria mercenaria TaxID=6596 RepID=UPI00234EC428|nr:C-type lectin BfL-2-like [Mercenaria mercenaria]
MDVVLRKTCFFLAVFGLLLQLALAANINRTASEDINGQYLLDMGRKLKDQTLQAIGIAFINLGKNRCGEWTPWSSCTAGTLGYFGIKGRKRTCGDELSVEKSEIDFSICGTLCPPDYYQTANRFCVKLHMSSKSYMDADSHCQAEGGYLINIDSHTKFTDIQNLNIYLSNKVFIGGRRKDAHSPWMFEYGNKNGYFRWGSGQPSNGSNELCLYIYGSSKLMYDANCQTKHPFICEIIM